MQKIRGSWLKSMAVMVGFVAVSGCGKDKVSDTPKLGDNAPKVEVHRASTSTGSNKQAMKAD